MEGASRHIGVVDFNGCSLVCNGEVAAQSGAIGSVVNTNQLEACNCELTSSQIETNGATSASDFVACAVVEAIQSCRFKTGADGRVGNAG